MAVYVDPLLHHGKRNAPHCFRGKPACHMYADTPEELHTMARRIGMKPSWFQRHPVVDHYDLVESRRDEAVRLGAIEHDRNQSVDKWKELRAKQAAHSGERPDQPPVANESTESPI